MKKNKDGFAFPAYGSGNRAGADGSKVKEKRFRYSCHYNVRHPSQCDGQSGYGVTKLDAIVESIVCTKFSEILECSKSKLLQDIVLSACGQRETLSRGSLRKGSRCDQSTGWLLGGQRLSGELVYWSFSGAGTAQCLRCQIRQVEYRRFAHSAGKVAVSCVCVHQKAIRHPAKTDAPPGCGERDLRYGRRTVRLGDLRERKKRPHLVENQIQKSFKEQFK